MTATEWTVTNSPPTASFLSSHFASIRLDNDDAGWRERPSRLSLGAGGYEHDDPSSQEEDDAPSTASDSDWSDAELREPDSDGKPPSAAQGGGRPWARLCRARRERNIARRAAAAIASVASPPSVAASEREEGRFIGDLDAATASRILERLSPVERARVAACRKTERDAMTCPGSRGGGSRDSRDRDDDSPRGPLGRGSGASDKGHLADAAWRDVHLSGIATSSALASLRRVACGALRRLDVSGSRGVRRGDLLEVARESPCLRALRCHGLGDVAGKFSVRDVELVFDACPSLRRFECDVGAKIDARGEPPGSAEARLAATLQARSISTPVPIRPRRRGERRSLRTFPGASLRPSHLAFDPRPRRLSTSTDTFQRRSFGGSCGFDG